MAEFPVTKPQFIVPSCVNLSTYIQGMSDYEVRCYYTQLVQQWATEWAQMQTEWSNQQEAFESFKQYVNDKLQTFQDWFDNLDVQNEINNKIDEMVSDGTFLTIIQSTVNSQTQAATDAWLQENMTPGAGAPALDSSLTLANAAAQSKAVGDRLNQSLVYRRHITEPTADSPINFDDLTDSGFYTFYFTRAEHNNGYVINAPFWRSAGIVFVARNPTTKYTYQFAYTRKGQNPAEPHNNTVAFRIFSGTQKNIEWVYLPSFDDFEGLQNEVQSVGNRLNQSLVYRRFITAPTADSPINFDDLTDSGFYTFYFTRAEHNNGYVINAPFWRSAGIVFVARNPTTKYTYQFAYTRKGQNPAEPHNNTVAFRIFSGTQKNIEWVYVPSFDDFEGLQNDVQGLQNDVQGLQNEVQELQKESLSSANPGVSMFDTVAVIGDSLSVGYYQTASGQQVRPVFKQSWPQYLVKKYGTKVFWCGFSGATTLTFLSSSDTTSAPYKTRGMNYVNEIGAKALYIVQLGVNDATRGVPLGTENDVGTNNDTFYGALSRIVTNVHALAPKAFILVATPVNNINDGYETAIEYVANHYDYCGFVDFRPYISQVSPLAYAGHYTELGYGYIGAIMDMLCGNTLNNTKFLRVNEANNSAADTDVDPYE